ncbi:MAG: hypothetical protein NZL85_11640, partial [Fimbriimonadales bacterium]|nr:hypothetical protein [Fimbriimonadales bacterium]
MTPEATDAVEVEVSVPCARRKKHRVRLRIKHWDEWEFVHSPCAELLGRAFGLMAPCSQYVHQRDGALRRAVAEALAKRGKPAVLALVQALGDSDEEV